jgi:hypothetical protein
MAKEGWNEEIWFRLNAPVCTVCADADAVSELPIDCTELTGFKSAPSAPTETVWPALKAALADESALAPFSWDRPPRIPELTTLRFVGLVWDACENARASCEAEICWLTSGERGEAMSEAADAAMSGAEAESEPTASEIVWVAPALAAAVASADTVFDCVTCGAAAVVAVAAAVVAAADAGPFDPSAGAEGPLPVVDVAADAGAPVHIQFHTQLQSQAWLRAKLAAAPFGPVHVQFQIHWPATGAGADEPDDEVSDAEEVELDVEPVFELLALEPPFETGVEGL